MYQNWTDENIDLVDSLSGYSEMAELALRILGGMPQPIVQVCGPISTGGRGSFEENIKMFHEGISLLAREGKIVFDQRPFELPIQKLKKLDKQSGYVYAILTDFYLPIFESGYIKELHFLPGWDSSIGARWEHEQGQRLGIKINYFSNNLLK